MATKRSDKYNDVNWKEQTSKVVRFCERQGFSVKFQKCPQSCSTICFADYEVIIHNGLTPERIFYCLLHEVGHLILHDNPQQYYQNTGFVVNNFSEQSLTTKIGEVEEEYEAWKEGYKKAKKMRLKVDRLEYEKLKASNLSTYFEWAIDRKINKKVDREVDREVRLALKKVASRKETK